MDANVSNVHSFWVDAGRLSLAVLIIIMAVALFYLIENFIVEPFARWAAYRLRKNDEDKELFLPLALLSLSTIVLFISLFFIALETIVRIV